MSHGGDGATLLGSHARGCSRRRAEMPETSPEREDKAEISMASPGPPERRRPDVPTGDLDYPLDAGVQEDSRVAVELLAMAREALAGRLWVIGGRCPSGDCVIVAAGVRPG